MQSQNPAAHVHSSGTPKKGDTFHCEKCGMALQVTADCKCTGDDHAHFHCCGEEMKKG
jgi:hypothetical protein